MGSRAVLLVCQDGPGTSGPFGAPGDMPGAVYTRTGRPFFRPAVAGQLLGTVRTAIDRQPGCGTSWGPAGCCWTAS